MADYRKLFETVENSAGYWATIPLTEFARSLDRLLKKQGLRRVDLADRLQLSPAYVSKVLSGQENVTVTTMAKFAMKIGGVVRVHVAGRDCGGRWIETPADRVIELVSYGDPPTGQQGDTRFNIDATLGNNGAELRVKQASFVL